MDRIPELNIHEDYLSYQVNAINQGIQHIKSDGADVGQISDGHHTFGELYEHRIALWMALCYAQATKMDDGGMSCSPIVWRSKRHSDGSAIDGWFLLGINKEPGKQMTYHLPASQWGECEFAETLDKAPAFDGHTSADVLQRLKEL